jgi:hypothetical protein
MRGSPDSQALAIAAVLVVVGTVTVMVRFSRFPRDSGYRFGADVIVRCRDGHLFTTTWVPLVSLKAIRLGMVRFQYCPLCDRPTFVILMRDSDLTDTERQIAALHRDRGIP